MDEDRFGCPNCGKEWPIGNYDWFQPCECWILGVPESRWPLESAWFPASIKDKNEHDPYLAVEL